MIRKFKVWDPETKQMFSSTTTDWQPTITLDGDIYIDGIPRSHCILRHQIPINGAAESPYEGDIIDLTFGKKSIRGVIEYDNAGGFRVRTCKHGYISIFTAFHDAEATVIGTDVENPELLP